MEYKIKNKKNEKILITDSNREFRVGQCIFFKMPTLNTKNKSYFGNYDYYIGKIIDILEDEIIIKDININYKSYDTEMTINLSEIKDKSCCYVI